MKNDCTEYEQGLNALFVFHKLEVGCEREYYSAILKLFYARF